MDSLKAVNFIRSDARPLELALYKYYYENGTKDRVIFELLKYMNDDCGFGNALEPDNWNKNSNPIAVNDAIITLFRIGALDERSKLTDRIVRYLSSHDCFDEEKKRISLSMLAEGEKEAARAAKRAAKDAEKEESADEQPVEE